MYVYIYRKRERDKNRTLASSCSKMSCVYIFEEDIWICNRNTIIIALHYFLFSFISFLYKLFTYRGLTLISAGQLFRIFRKQSVHPDCTNNSLLDVWLQGDQSKCRQDKCTVLFVSFSSNVEALVGLCNTVNRIGVSLFHTQTGCESNQPAWILNKNKKKRKKICTTQILFENLFCIKTYADINFWELSRADHLSLVYAFSKERLFFFCFCFQPV